MDSLDPPCRRIRGSPAVGARDDVSHPGARSPQQLTKLPRSGFVQSGMIMRIRPAQLRREDVAPAAAAGVPYFVSSAVVRGLLGVLWLAGVAEGLASALLELE
jgi:hypothetical protein